MIGYLLKPTQPEYPTLTEFSMSGLARVRDKKHGGIGLGYGRLGLMWGSVEKGKEG